jgi:tetratricopeptide (TPR) repeat protein
MNWRAAIMAAVLALPAFEARAQDQSELWRRCEQVDQTDKKAWIANCTAVIESGQETGRRLATAYFYRGVAHRRTGEHDKAIADHSESARIDPSYANAHLGRGRVHADRFDYDAAIRDFTEAIRLDATYVGTFVLRGEAYLAKKSYEEALKDFEEAIRLDRSMSSAYYGRRKAYEGLGQNEKAWQSDPGAWTYGCGVSWQSGAYEKAMEYCNKALAIRPDYSGALFYRGVMLLEGGRYEAAIADFDSLVKAVAAGVPLLSGKESEMAVVFGLRGLANLGLGQHEAAISDLSEGLQLGALAPLYLYARGLARLRNGDAVGGAADLAAVTEDHAKIVQALAEYGIK